MTYQEFLQLVEEMRTAQKTYFSNRTQNNLLTSKRLEKLVDNAIAEGKFYDANQAQESDAAQMDLFENW